MANDSNILTAENYITGSEVAQYLTDYRGSYTAQTIRSMLYDMLDDRYDENFENYNSKYTQAQFLQAISEFNAVVSESSRVTADEIDEGIDRDIFIEQQRLLLRANSVGDQVFDFKRDGGLENIESLNPDDGEHLFVIERKDVFTELLNGNPIESIEFPPQIQIKVNDDLAALRETLTRAGYDERDVESAGSQDRLLSRTIQGYEPPNRSELGARLSLLKEDFAFTSKEPMISAYEPDGNAVKAYLESAVEMRTRAELAAHGSTPDSVAAYRARVVDAAFEHLGNSETVEDAAQEGNNRVASHGYLPLDKDGNAWCAGFADFLRNAGADGIPLLKAVGNSDNLAVFNQINNGRANNAFHAFNSGYEPQVGDTILLYHRGGSINGYGHASTIVGFERDPSTNAVVSIRTVDGNVLDRVAMLSIQPDSRGYILDGSMQIQGYIDNGALYEASKSNPVVNVAETTLSNEWKR